MSNLLNPQIAVFYTSLLPGLVPDGAPEGPAPIGLVLVHGLLTLGWLVQCAAVLLRASASCSARPSGARWTA